MHKHLLLMMVFSGLSFFPAAAKKVKPVKNSLKIDTSLINNLKYRNIGPFRGGRSSAVTGVPGRSGTFYMGSAGGGIWKSTDAGNSWKNISDGYFGGSIGSVAVSASDPNVIYVGGGEVTVRGNVSHGYGIWKSLDAGKTWKYSGLKEGQYIPRIRIHPGNPDLIYATVLGHLFEPNRERGIYRSADGGKTWEKVLYISKNAGACDLILDPENPRIIYASTWNIRRTPYSLKSGGPGSALWKSTDGGDTWSSLINKPGFPKGTLGIIGVTVSPAMHDRIWAIVEADKGGLFRSDDGGNHWQRVNSERSIRQRAWYYSRIYADPVNPEKVYVLNVSFQVSADGGKSFKRIGTPHGDNHDLWIAPDNPKILIIGDDGGAQVTVNGGQSWTGYNNQPTAQFYRLSTDNHFPYRIYAAQQDNSAIRINHLTGGRPGSQSGWETTAGGESGYIVTDPRNDDVVYGGSYGGYLVRVNHKTGERRSVNIWPDNPMGWGAKYLKYRFQWNYPILFSKHDPSTLYAAGNILFKTTNEGQSWQAVSPDLTRHDTATLCASGGPITKDNTGVEYYATIFAVAESNFEPGVIWTGSDDGLLYITRDGGKTWKNITPGGNLIPVRTMVNSIEASPFDKGSAYVAATAYKTGDYTPYLLKTSDYGATWTLITRGIRSTHFTRVVRADPVRRGLLFAGTESGMYISFDDGMNWQPFQLNLPIVPVTDLNIKNQDLIVATQGRALWILDDLSPLEQIQPVSPGPGFELFSPRPAYRLPGRAGFGKGSAYSGGPVINFYLKNDTGKVPARLDILDSDGNRIKSYRTNVKRKGLESDSRLGTLDARKGLNRFLWNMRYPGAKSFKGLIMWGGSTIGPVTPPGKYTAKLVVGKDSAEVSFELKKNPQSSAGEEDLKEQFDFLISCRDKLSEVHAAIIKIRKLKIQINDLMEKIDRKKHKQIYDLAKQTLDVSGEIEQALYQTKNQSRQDPLNFPIKLNNKLAALAGDVSVGDNRPTDQAYQVKAELFIKIDKELDRFAIIKQAYLPKLNRLISDQKVQIIKL